MVAAAIVGFAPLAAHAGMGVLKIRDDVGGGDCSLIGSWDAMTRTCTLAADVHDAVDPELWAAIEIESSNITLDGAGHTIVGLGAEFGRWAILYGNYVSGVTIRNLRIAEFGGGIVNSGAGDNFVIENSEFTASAIQLRWFTDVRILGNSFVNSSVYLDGVQRFEVQGNSWWMPDWPCYGITAVYGAADGLIAHNVLQQSKEPFNFVWADRIVVRDNTLTFDAAAGLNPTCAPFVLGTFNQFFHNDFIGVPPFVVDALSTGNVFNLDKPAGGNFWSDHACSDVNADGFCDVPYIMANAVDALPFTKAGGWLDDDNDGWNRVLDCNDSDASVHPGASEMKHDGIDQDCNGYDLTIDVTKAHYTVSDAMLRVEAMSDLGSAAALEVSGVGAMSWRVNQADWVLSVPVTSAPGDVIVCGIEGCASATVLEQ